MKKNLLIPILIFTLFISLSFAYSNSAEATGQSAQLIIINKTTNQLAYYNDGQLVRIFYVGTGRSDSLTPEGTFQIVNKIKNRPYYKENIPGGHPSNPLGDRWLGLNARGTYGTTYAIHGNSNPSSIGKYVSAGCVRMHNDEVRWLFDEVKMYTTVIIGHFDSFEKAAQKAGYQLPSPIEVFINDSELKMEVKPVLIDGRVLIPIRSIFSELGATVEWNGKKQSITVSKDNTTVKLQIGSKKSDVNGKETILDVPVQMVNGHTYVPIRFVTEALGFEVRWNSNNRMITIVKEEKETVSVNLLLNGKLNPLQEMSYIKNQTTMVPLRGIVEELGVSLMWDAQNGTIIATKQSVTLQLKINESIASLNGVAIDLDVPVEVYNSTTFVPVRLISEAFGASIGWNTNTHTVEIVTN